MKPTPSATAFLLGGLLAAGTIAGVDAFAPPAARLAAG
eukprot:CAMPEP_0113582298 /NCGR_PEP_ID=MMETSP0015_2-20120614/31824_1 /TAXON_ID=2838 /ORGANISM="Odontella" /LENGTH=37 /DNA_ID=CAMNT_0000486929 /DNA_START=123 /DNA_END=232 /DNA_ORIENTATION=+ /assembly_acc=CAM_ASM_000160